MRHRILVPSFCQHLRHHIPAYPPPPWGTSPPPQGTAISSPFLCVLGCFGPFIDFLKKIKNSKTLAVLFMEIGRGGWESSGQLLLRAKFGDESRPGLSFACSLPEDGR